MVDPKHEQPIDPEDFEALVAAALKVDPEGITGQRAAPKDDEASDG